jgi:hypothetical protein
METQPRDRPPKVFLSYAQSDRFKVDQIAAALRTAGVSIWFDAWELAPGDTIIERVERAVQASDVFLVFLSPASIESRWVHAELARWLRAAVGASGIPRGAGRPQPAARRRNGRHAPAL